MAIIVRAGAGETWCILGGSHIENLWAGETSLDDEGSAPSKIPQKELKKVQKGEVTFLPRAQSTPPPSPWKKPQMI